MRRTREIGVRMALGAARRDVLRLVVREGMQLTFIGIAIGMAVALATTRLLRQFLFGVSPLDPFVFVSIPVLLAGIALLASYVPARRAASADPVTALRADG